ncbi:MAG: serine hydrolase, partial [Sneathiella sp.]|nr:serine hydrolase [Sneathiella sp.]
ATDVVGRLAEIWSGNSLEAFLDERIFTPLAMTDTGFEVKEENRARFTSNYSVEEGILGPVLDAAATSHYLSPPEFVAGAGGLVSTADDYLQFLRMLLGRGELNGHRIVKKETFNLMIENHLVGDMADMGAGDFNDASWEGIGFGLGFNVVLDPLKTGSVAPAGEYGWTGAAGTVFFVHPELNMATLLLTQYMPSKTYPLRAEFRQAVYDGLI